MTLSSERDSNFCFPIPDVLENDRIKLVPFIPSEHAETVFETWKASPKLLDYIPLGPFETIEDWIRGLWEGRVLPKNGETLFAIYDKTQPRGPTLAGTIGLINSSANDLSTEIGCIIIFPQFQRTHVTSNAVGLLMHYALDLPKDGGLGCRRLQWFANANNSASVGLAKKMSFEPEGILKWHRALAKGKDHNGFDLRNGDPREGYMSRDSALLATYWDSWENGGRQKVDERMARTV